MAKRWGFSHWTIFNTLKKLGVKFVHKGWTSKESKFDKIVKKQKSIENIIKLHKGRIIKDVASELGISDTYLRKSLIRRGYKYDRKKKEWH